MNDFPTLTEAFAELERRADLAGASRPEPSALHAPPRHRARLVLVAASVVAVGAVAGGATLLADGSGSKTQAGGTAPTTHSSAVVSSSPVPHIFRIPQTPDELTQRFRVVLDDVVGAGTTFTVTDTGTPVNVTVPAHSPANASPGGRVTAAPPVAGTPNGAAIVGTLTSGGRTGGYDVQIFQATPGTKAMCDEPDRAHCAPRTFADGGSIAVGHERLPGSANGVTYVVEYVRPDGVEFILHVSNERSPKGASDVLAPQPPLTRKQMTAIVMSNRW